MQTVKNMPEGMTLEKLWAQVEQLRREAQSSKDKAVKQANQRLDKMEETLAKLVELLES